MNPTKTFRMNKQTKRLMATITDANERNVFKSVMIQAQLASEQKPVKEKEKK